MFLAGLNCKTVKTIERPKQNKFDFQAFAHYLGLPFDIWAQKRCHLLIMTLVCQGACQFEVNVSCHLHLLSVYSLYQCMTIMPCGPGNVMTLRNVCVNPKSLAVTSDPTQDSTVTRLIPAVHGRCGLVCLVWVTSRWTHRTRSRTAHFCWAKPLIRLVTKCIILIDLHRLSIWTFSWTFVLFVSLLNV